MPGWRSGATQGYIYLRVEYPHAARALAKALQVARAVGYLGQDMLGSGKRFDIAVRLGAGAYICGEETSMLESLEGRRGEVRVRPPLPAIKGLFGQPTVVNNVVTLASVPVVLARGAQFYKDFGAGKSRGTIPLQLAGNVKHAGLVERAFGLTVKELVYDYGGGSASRAPGARGADRWAARRLSAGIGIRHAAGIRGAVGEERVAGSRWRGGVRRSRRHGAHGALRAGVLRHRVLRQVHALPHRFRRAAWSWWIASSPPARAPTVPTARTNANLALLDELCDTMFNGSLCGLGGLTPFPVRSALKHFKEDFQRTLTTSARGD